MRRDDRGVLLFLSLAVAFYFASIAFAEKSGEDLRQAAYEQVEGPAAGKGQLAPVAPARSRLGLKTPPASTQPALRAVSLPLPAAPRLPRAPAGEEEAAVPGLLISALLGLSIGGGVGLLTSHYGAGGTEDRG